MWMWVTFLFATDWTVSLSNLEAHVLVLFSLASFLCFGVRYMIHQVLAIIEDLDEWKARRRGRRVESSSRFNPSPR
jgi:uncharacterized protein HemY